MADMSLDDIRNEARQRRSADDTIIDTTKGKIEKPVDYTPQHRPSSTELDPIFSDDYNRRPAKAREEKPAPNPMGTSYSRRMNIGDNPKPMNTTVFRKEEAPKEDPMMSSAYDSLDSGVERLKHRIDEQADYIMKEYESGEQEALEKGLIKPVEEETKQEPVPMSEAEREASIMDDDPYAGEDDDGYDLTTIAPEPEFNGSNFNEVLTAEQYSPETFIDTSNPTYQHALDDFLHDIEEDERHAEIVTTNAINDEDELRDVLNEAKVNQYTMDNNPEDNIDVIDEPPVREKDNTEVEQEATPVAEEVPAPSPNDLPTVNPAVDFDDEFDDDDIYNEDNEDEDEDIDDGDEEDEEAAEEERKEKEAADRFRDDVKKTIKPVKNSINFNSFSIRKKPISASKVMKVQTTRTNVTDWVMPTVGRPISVTELSGMEIIKMNPQESGRNRINTMRDMYRIMYDHVQDANKPEYEEWMKSVSFTDIPHIQFALYKATFEHSNFLHYSCEHCKNIALKSVPLMDMVKFENDEAKKRFDKILSKDTTSPSEGYEVSLHQISDNYVFALKLPSAYNVVIEIASLPNDFVNKYSDLIDLISFIDDIYYIDRKNNTLIPISTNPVKDDVTKSSTRKIRIYNDILKTLSSDEYFTLRSKIDNLGADMTSITYRIPETKCPECGEIIQGQDDVDPTELLFTRHQLGAITAI